MTDIGIIVTISNLIIAFLIPFLGVLVDYYGRKPFIIFTGLLLAASLYLAGSYKVYWVLILSYSLSIFSFMAGQPARGALLAESVSPERMGEAFGLVTSTFFIGRVLIPPLSGYIADNIGYSNAFYMGSIVALFGSIIFSVYGLETLKERVTPRLNELLNMLKPKRELIWLYIGCMIDRFGWALWMSLLNAYLMDVYEISATGVGLMNSLLGISSMLTQYLAGRLIDKIGYIRGLILSEFTGFIASLFLGSTYIVYGAALALIIVGISISLWTPSYNNAVSLNTRPEYRALEYSKVNSYRVFISVPAPYLGGYLYDMISPSTPFLLSSLVMFTATIFFYIVGRRYVWVRNLS